MVEKKIVVIADSYTAIAFKLLGAEAYMVEEGVKARELLQKILERNDVGVVLIANQFEQYVADLIEKVRAEKPQLVISLLPTLKYPGKPVDMRRLLLQALGVG